MIKRIVLELDEKIHKQFKLRATKEGRSMREILQELLLKWLSK